MWHHPSRASHAMSDHVLTACRHPGGSKRPSRLLTMLPGRQYLSGMATGSTIELHSCMKCRLPEFATPGVVYECPTPQPSAIALVMAVCTFRNALVRHAASSASVTDSGTAPDTSSRVCGSTADPCSRQANLSLHRQHHACSSILLCCCHAALFSASSPAVQIRDTSASINLNTEGHTIISRKRTHSALQPVGGASSCGHA